MVATLASHLRATGRSRTCAALAYSTATFIATGCSVERVDYRKEVVYAGRIPTTSASGEPNPWTTVDLNAVVPTETCRLPLDGGRWIEIRSSVPEASANELQQIRDRVERCYQFVEDRSGLTIRGDVLLFLIPADLTAHSYEHRFRCSDHDAFRWAWVDAVLVSPNAIGTGGLACGSLEWELFCILPHELSHHALDSLDNLEQDSSLEGTVGTRWFTDGTGELLAAEFARAENPAAAQELLARRRLGTVLEDSEIRNEIFQWGGNPEDPSWDSPSDRDPERYDAALLLMMAWTREAPLREIIAKVRVSSRPVGGRELMSVLKETAGMDPETLVNRARGIGAEFQRSKPGDRDRESTPAK
jgi:hypothetical protein